jgi:GGDEF domain-containing protein
VTLRLSGVAYLLEVAAGVVVLAVLNAAAFPRDPGMLRVALHPGLFVVAAVAARHGLREGMMAATVITGAAIVAFIGAGGAVAVDALREPRMWLAPFLLGLTGFILGAVREERRQETRVLEARVAELEHELAEQAVRFMAAAETKHELERRVAEETASLSALYDAMRSLDALDVDRLYPAVLGTVRRLLQADACQVYLVDGGALRLRAAEGPPPSRAELPVNEGLTGLAVQRGRPASVRDLAHVTSLDDLREAPLLMAAPVLDREGALLGCLTVSRLPFLKLTPAALDRLGLVADWAGRALANALLHERARGRAIQDEMLGAYTYAYYQRRLEEETRRARRFNRPLSVLVFRIVDLESVTPARRVELSRVLTLVFSRVVRNVDLICRYATDDAFAIILPETSAAEAEILRARAEREIHGFHFLPYPEEERELEFALRVLPVHEPRTP